MSAVRNVPFFISPRAPEHLPLWRTRFRVPNDQTSNVIRDYSSFLRVPLASLFSTFSSGVCFFPERTGRKCPPVNKRFLRAFDSGNLPEKCEQLLLSAVCLLPCLPGRPRLALIDLCRVKGHRAEDDSGRHGDSLPLVPWRSAPPVNGVKL